MTQKGFSAILIITVVVLIFSGVAFFIFSQNSKKVEQKQSGDSKVTSLPTHPSSGRQNDKNDDNEPSLKLKSIGVDFSDFKFTKEKLQFNRLIMGYGFVIPASPDNPSKANPQPTYILPLGTPVRSLVDGIVANMPTLWSGDISIQVTKSGQLERWVYEVEHVINPKVKVGDKVVAGQIIAEVSDFDKGAPKGFGAVEIGLLHGGGEGPPEHVCPFAYLDESIKEETFKKMDELFKSWEEYVGDSTLYGETPIPGCLTLDPIEG
jgi:hypothetical protein